MYAAVPDPYCYKGTAVLKNIPDLRNQAALDAFEAAMTLQRADEPLPAGRLSVTHYRAIHRHLFQDVYSWAGRYRSVRISKGDSMFCYPERIAAEMVRVFAELKHDKYCADFTPPDFAARAAHFLAELNAIHPFREGNGRAQNSFLKLLSDFAGHPMDLQKLDPQKFLAAMIASFAGNEEPLSEEIANLIT